MKYILFEDTAGHPVPVIFPDRIIHAEMREQMPYGTVLAAGYVEMGPDGFRCHGESKALHAAARPEDAAVLTAAFAPEEA